MDQILFKDAVKQENVLQYKDSERKKVGVKRQRSENWNEEDKLLLKELIKKRVKDIENKNTDTNTNKIKKKAWLELEKDFNDFCSCEKLKSQWTNIKVQARKEVSHFRKEARQTGGGPAPPVVPTLGNDISAWLPNEFVVDENEFDSDVVDIAKAVCDTELGVLSEDKERCPKRDQTNEEDVIELDKSPQTLNEHEVQTVRPSKKKKLTTEKSRVVDDNIVKIAQADVECRMELHLLQVEAEKKKIKKPGFGI